MLLVPLNSNSWSKKCSLQEQRVRLARQGSKRVLVSKKKTALAVFFLIICFLTLFSVSYVYNARRAFLYPFTFI
jgi:hypothetical protein